uniref:limulus clotting factor C n=1 Tax=Cupiennius salei TaxID=6928 RepID=A0A4Y5UGE5_CUPSA|nr:venom serine protease 2 isoform S1 [Cupiennius salei]QDC23056.1 venom serine protease 2 isoform S2 [Cupiennius salei]QDC23057.1 venom serine protease 2 isoform S3 [Cupiennius salei]
MIAAICVLCCLQLIRGIPLEQISEADTRPLCPCGDDDSSLNTRVVGGHAASRHQFPYASSILFRPHFGDRELREFIRSTPFCGGTLITDRHVITAAHCLKERFPEDIAVDVGDYSLKEKRGKQILNSRNLTRFPEYIKTSFHTDIAIVELEHPVQFRSGLMTARLPPPDLDLKPGTTVSVYGWGRLSYYGDHPDVLNSVDLPVVDSKQCQPKFVSRIEPAMICAGGQKGKDACIGDSGSGLVVRLDNKFVLCGVVSFGRRCALPDVPGVYTRVSSFVDWILKQTQSASCRPCVYGKS